MALPRQLPTPCTFPGGCSALVPGGGRCPRHRDRPFAGAIRTVERTGTRAQTYGSPRWRSAQRTHLANHPDCACGTQATTVDHDPPHDGTPATFWDTSTWQSRCKPCHDSKSGREARARRVQGTTLSQPGPRFAIPVTAVCGPPGSGKSSYVQERAKWGDLVVDVDALYGAVSGLPLYEKPDVLLPLVMEARDALIARLSRPSQVRHAWVILGGARREDRARLTSRGARAVVLEIEASECIRRIALDPRRSANWRLWEPLVREWWERYER